MFVKTERSLVIVFDSVLGTVGAAPAFAAPSGGHGVSDDVLFAAAIFHIHSRIVWR
jgi:hypothetical protein